MKCGLPITTLYACFSFAFYLSYLSNRLLLRILVRENVFAPGTKYFILVTKNKEKRKGPLQVHPISTLVQNHPANE